MINLFIAAVVGGLTYIVFREANDMGILLLLLIGILLVLLSRIPLISWLFLGLFRN